MMDEISEEIHKTRTPELRCPECGQIPQTKTSFKGRGQFRNKRKTQICSCGWSNIIPTEREAETQIGLID